MKVENRIEQAENDQISRIPVNEIFVKLKTDRRTFFRVKLCCENILMSDGTAKTNAVLSIANHVFRMIGNSIEAVYKVKETVIVNSLPQGMGPGLAYLIPSHLGYFIS